MDLLWNSFKLWTCLKFLLNQPYTFYKIHKDFALRTPTGPTKSIPSMLNLYQANPSHLNKRCSLIFFLRSIIDGHFVMSTPLFLDCILDQLIACYKSSLLNERYFIPLTGTFVILKQMWNPSLWFSLLTLKSTESIISATTSCWTLLMILYLSLPSQLEK